MMSLTVLAVLIYNDDNSLTNMQTLVKASNSTQLFSLILEGVLRKLNVSSRLIFVRPPVRYSDN
jgi:hypothetical protein